MSITIDNERYNVEGLKFKIGDKQYNIEGLRIVATYDCNRNCKFCYQIRKGSVFLTEYSLKIVLHICKKFKFNPSYITFQGGELSLYPEETFKLIKLTHDYFPKVFCKSLTTNGYGDIEFYKKLKLYGITNITISFHNKDAIVERTLLELKKDGFYTVRVNCFLYKNIENVKYVFNFCKDNDIQLTLCEDLNLSNSENFDSSNFLYKHILNDSYKEENSLNQSIFCSEDDNYIFWVYRHFNHYNYDNLIVMPNGNVTCDFDDILNCQGSK